jgi:hypothetical protein
MLRRRTTRPPADRGDPAQRRLSFIEIGPDQQMWEYAALVTSLDDEILTLGQLYRDRAICENAFDELKNQWGWGGFTTQDLARCRLLAGMVALIYNWFGFVACAERIASQLTDIKMLTSITTSQFTERLIYLMLVDGHYRKYLARLHERLGEARMETVRAFERIGLELFAEPADGMFVWARFPNVEDSLPLAESSQREGVMLAPGTVFRPHLERSPWLCFNVTFCADQRVQNWLQRLASSLGDKGRSSG